MISRQTDKQYTADMAKTINEIQQVMDASIPGLAKYKPDKIGTVYELQKQSKKAMLDKELKVLSSILTNRFNIKIKVRNLAMPKMKISSIIMPLLNYTTVNIALQNLNALFPKKRADSATWSIQVNHNEKAIHDTMVDITRAMKEDSLKIDKHSAKIYGLQKSRFTINIDFLTTIILGLTPEEVTSVIVYEVGRIFAYLSRVTSTVNTNQVLLSTFLDERYTKQQSPVKAVNLALAKVNNKPLTDSNGLSVLEPLTLYITETLNSENTYTDGLINYQKSADVFVARFDLSDNLAKAIGKQASNGLVKLTEADSITGGIIIGGVIDFLKLVTTIVAIVILASISIIIALAYGIYKLFLFIINLMVSTIYNIMSSLFNIKEDSPGFETVIRRLHTLILDNIRQIRTSKLSNKDEQELIEQIEIIKEVSKSLSKNLDKLNSYGYTDNVVNLNVKIEDMIEDLEENEMYLVGTKFNNIK